MYIIQDKSPYPAEGLEHVREGVVCAQAPAKTEDCRRRLPGTTTSLNVLWRRVSSLPAGGHLLSRLWSPLPGDWLIHLFRIYRRTRHSTELSVWNVSDWWLISILMMICARDRACRQSGVTRTFFGCESHMWVYVWCVIKINVV